MTNGLVELEGTVEGVGPKTIEAIQKGYPG